MTYSILHANNSLLTIVVLEESKSKMQSVFLSTSRDPSLLVFLVPPAIDLDLGFVILTKPRKFCFQGFKNHVVVADDPTLSKYYFAWLTSAHQPKACRG